MFNLRLLVVLQRPLLPRPGTNFLTLLHDFIQRLPTDVPIDLPCRKRMSLLEDLFYFLQGPTDGFGEHEEDLYERCKVEGTKDEVRFPCDAVEPWWDGECECGVECPVGCLMIEN